jgi:tRNA A37 threonylcarbamoyladenosine synthetase subunit TsaC/SUA5/YrdC
LLCSTAKLDGADAGSGVPDAATFLDAFAPRGLDFVVDVGPRPAELSTVVDLSEGEPEVLRQGRGEVVW